MGEESFDTARAQSDLENVDDVLHCSSVYIS